MIAFYAPLKPPEHAVPSGDRAMARALVEALAPLGPVLIASELRSLDLAGDAGTQARIMAEAEDEASRLTAHLPVETRLWVTYHNYYKAPDLLGPAVSAARRIPYVQIESTRARKRLTGPWSAFAAAAEAASDAAQVIFYLTERDGEALQANRPTGQKLVHLRPFLTRRRLTETAALKQGAPILSVGMMRAGDKLASYALIAKALAELTGDWQLEIAGNGPAMAEVERLMTPFGDRVRFLGRLDGQSLSEAYGRAGLFFWPGVNEAFGMVYLEAQAAGLPVVAQDRPGVREVLAAPQPSMEDGPQAMAQAIAKLLGSPEQRARAGAEAQAHVARNHLLDAASATLSRAFLPLIGTSG